MKPACIQAVNAAAGRTLSAAEIRGIDERIDGAMRQLARTEPTWRSLSIAERVALAAETAMREMEAAAARKVANAQRQIIATAATNARIDELQRVILKGKGRRGDALIADINNTSLYIDGVKREAMSNLKGLLEASTSREDASAGRSALMFLFDAENPRMTHDLVQEIFGNGQGLTGNAMAQKGAQAWLKTTEELRGRFNNAGGDVGKLSYGYLSQAHDAIKVREATADGWAARVLPLLDRTRYVDINGRPLNDGEVLQILIKAHETIATDGLNKTEPGQITGTGARANRGSDSRQIHFKDGDAYLDYMAEFGTGSVYDAMLSHIGAMARDIGLVERYGPNPEAQFRLQNDLAVRADGGETRSWLNKPQAYWDMVSGKTGAPDSQLLANVGLGIRNVQTMGKLQGAVLSSITDVGTMVLTTGFNKLSYWELFRNVADQATSSAAREFALTHGIIAESVAGGINRWAGEHLSNGWAGKISNATMRLSLMNAWTDTMRNAFAMTMMNGLARLSKTDWGALTEWDRSHLMRKGISESDWGVITQAQLTAKDGREYLTPTAIRDTGHPQASQVISKVLGFIKDESEYAIINPDLATRGWATWGGQQAGTGVGELARMTMQFKSFPVAMMSRHWRRLLDSGRHLEGAPALANPFAYGVALVLTTTALGAIAFQAKQLFAGRDPVDMTTLKFWERAAMQGGGLGFMGDILLGDTTQDRGQLDSLGRLVLGPTFGSAADLFELTKGNLDEALAGKDTHIGAEAVRAARSHLPFVNLWYAKGVLDHMLVHAMQENLSPGYLGRMRGRAMKEWGQSSWWEPGEELPSRAPNFGAAVGEQ